MAQRNTAGIILILANSCVPSLAQDLKTGNTVWAGRDAVGCNTVDDAYYALKFERADKQTGTRFDFPKPIVALFHADRCRVIPSGQQGTVRRMQGEIICVQEHGEVDCLWTGREYVSRTKPLD